MRPSRTRLLGSLIVIAAVLLAGAPLPAGTPEAGQSSILLVTVDALRPDHLGCYGDERGITKAIDGLAAGGVLFERFYANGAWTVPSVCAMLTSLAPSVQSPDPADEALHRGRTVAEELRAAGYRTAAIVANPHLASSLGYARGFDDYSNPSLGGASGEAGEDRRESGRTPAAGTLGAVWKQIRARTAGGNRAYNPVNDTGDFVTAGAIEWLAAHGDRPFFLWLHYLDPHFPYHPPDSFALPVVAAFPRRRDLFYLTLFSVWRKPSLFSEDYRKYLSEMYRNEVAFVDEQVGRLVAFLEEAGLSAKTAVVLTADHGEELWDHGGFEHGHSLHEEVVRVPLVVRLPGRSRAGTRILAPGQMLDLAPALLDLAGVSIPPEFQGRSFLSALEGGAQARMGDSPEASPIFLEGTRYGPRRWAVLDGDLKVILTEGDPTPEVYDLAADPREQTNRGEDFPSRAKSAVERIGAWRDSNAALGRALPARIDAPSGPPAGSEERLRSLGYGG